jgi:teichuronic acid biosynthesis glycosyltransferase TuaG
MYKNVKVSIILPNYNSEKYLIKTVKSVLSQTFKNWELIIVDDNSNLNTLKVLKKFKRNKKIRIFYLKKKQRCRIL